jgi:hypothetical protein
VTGAENTILVTRIPVSEPRLTATDRVVPTNAEAIGVGFGTASEKELPVSLPAHAKDRMGEETRGAPSPPAHAVLLCPPFPP